MKRIALLTALLAFWSTAAEATCWLKQSTAVDLAMGPFVDSTDGVTAKAALTLSQADVRLKKNGGAWAQKNDATTCVGAGDDEENGWYECPLDSTDTNTLGRLVIAINESGALPVWKECMVLAAASYDQLVTNGLQDNNYTVHRYALKKGTTSFIATFNVGDITTGGAFAGLTFDESGISAYYTRADQGNNGATAITLATATLGSYTSGGLVLKDGTNVPGEVEFGVPNACLATGSPWCKVTIKGPTNMKPIILMFELVDNVAADLVAGNVLTAGGTYRRSVASQKYPLYMVDTDGNGKTALTPAVTLSKDGATGAAIAGTVAEIDSSALPGWYIISLDAEDTDCAVCAFKATASGAVPRAFYFTTAP